MSEKITVKSEQGSDEPQNIPIPPKDELYALYYGTHQICQGNRFTFQKIAQHYTKFYGVLVSKKIVREWFEFYKLVGERRKNPIPPKEELLALYYGKHAVCQGKQFTLREIAQYYTSKYGQKVYGSTVWRWLEYYEVVTSKIKKIKQKKPKQSPSNCKRPPRELLLKLYRDPNITVKMIAEMFDVLVRRVYKWLDYYGIKRNQNQNYGSISPEIIQKIVLAYIRLKGSETIGDELHMSGEKIRGILKSAGIRILKNYHRTKVVRHINEGFWILAPKEILEMLEGSMLGDGNARCVSDAKGKKWEGSLEEYKKAHDTLIRLQTAKIEEEWKATI
ncbi:MAG: hypothetical protein ACFFCZ_31505, partial [Promethearchaeota archaeon]